MIGWILSLYLSQIVLKTYTSFLLSVRPLKSVSLIQYTVLYSEASLEMSVRLFVKKISWLCCYITINFFFSYFFFLSFSRSLSN